MATREIVKQFWTPGVTVVAPQTLAKGAIARGTIDLRDKLGAKLTLKIGRTGATALLVGVKIRINAVENNDAATPGGQSSPVWGVIGTLTAANATIVNADSPAGQNELRLAAITGFAVDDWLCVQDTGGGVTRLEFVQIAKLTVASGTGVTLTRPLAFTHTSAQADTVLNKADVFNEFELPGDSIYEVVFDYAAELAASQSVTVVSTARTLDYIYRDSIAI